MDCSKSLELLSEYRAGALEESESILVRTHLSACEDCDGVFKDLELILQAAASLRNANGFAYPDENVVWQRLSLSKGPVH
ncbi:MAG: zf-HC2 domain-containing protein [Acidobacteriota bacterium]|nr:zf-HC2 domain-containing protein [Acidobacteriota bacterium]